MREKLIELIAAVLLWENVTIDKVCKHVADHLIAHGVILVEDNNSPCKGLVDLAAIMQAIKPKADSTLNAMKKADLIDYIRCLENNYNTAVWFNENQARYVESLKLPKWISVSERKPKLIPCSAGTAYSDAVNALTSGRKVITAIWDGKDFIGDAAFWDAEDEIITHWSPVLAPLPDSSKES